MARLILAAAAHLARRDFGPARALLETARARFPNALPPRVYLSRVLLEEGTDLDPKGI